MRVKLGSSSIKRTRILSIGPSLPGSDAPEYNGRPRSATARLVRDSNRPAVQRHDGLADRQPQAGSLSRRLRREERIEEPGADGLVDARPGVFDLHDDDGLPHLELVRLAGPHLLAHLRQPIAPGAEDQRPY